MATTIAIHSLEAENLAKQRNWRPHTPFFMVYSSDVIIPADLIHGAPIVTFKSIAEAEKSRAEDLDMLEEDRHDVVLQAARYQQSAEALLRQERENKNIQHWRPCPQKKKHNRGSEQIELPMGRALHCISSTRASHLQARRFRRC